MHHIQGAGADFHAVKGELAKALHECRSIEVREDILAALFAGAEMCQLAISLCRCDIEPKYFQSQSVCQFCLLQFPNWERVALGRHLLLHPLGALLAEVEFQKCAGIQIE